MVKNLKSKIIIPLLAMGVVIGSTASTVLAYPNCTNTSWSFYCGNAGYDYSPDAREKRDDSSAWVQTDSQIPSGKYLQAWVCDQYGNDIRTRTGVVVTMDNNSRLNRYVPNYAYEDNVHFVKMKFYSSYGSLWYANGQWSPDSV